MEIITMESAAYKDIVGRIEEIASHVRRQGMEGQRNDTACLLDSREVMRLLCVSRRTLQRPICLRRASAPAISLLTSAAAVQRSCC